MTLTTLTPEEELVEAARQVVRTEAESIVTRGFDDARDQQGRTVVRRYEANADWLHECLCAYEAGPGPE